MVRWKTIVDALKALGNLRASFAEAKARDPDEVMPPPRPRKERQPRRRGPRIEIDGVTHNQ